MKYPLFTIILFCSHTLFTQETFTLESAIDYALNNHNSMRVAFLNGEEVWVPGTPDDESEAT